MRKLVILIIFLMLVSSLLMAFSNDLESYLNKLEEDESVSADSVFSVISNWDKYKACENKGEFSLKYNQINDTTNAPYVVYIPEHYNQAKKTPLLVVLHGGVGRGSFYPKPLEMAKNNDFIPYADSENWFVLQPLGKRNYTWWDDPGLANIITQITLLKQKYNIDDNKVYVTGFSDGGSGSFHLGLVKPDIFASLFPLNGFISVASIETNTPAFVKNLMNRSIFAINTDLDKLYAAKNMKPLMELAISHGANIFYKEYHGIGHDFSYAPDEIPIMIQNMKNNCRNIFRPKIYWETWTDSYGKCDWIEITKLDTNKTKKSWQQEYNQKIPDERIMFGFFPDEDFSEKGIKVNSVMDSLTTAGKMGLKAGDIIISMDNKPIKNLNDMSRIKEDKARGDKVSLTVLRNNKQEKLQGQFPDTTYYDAFRYNLGSGAVQGEYCANEFNIETSRVNEIALYLHPYMVNFDIPLVVNINGKEVFSEKIKADKDFLIKNFLNNYDRTALWAKRLVFNIE